MLKPAVVVTRTLARRVGTPLLLAVCVVAVATLAGASQARVVEGTVVSTVGGDVGSAPQPAFTSRASVTATAADAAPKRSASAARAKANAAANDDDPRPGWADFEPGPPPGQWTEPLPEGITKGTDANGQFCLMRDGVCVPKRTEAQALASEWTTAPPVSLGITVWPTTLYEDEILHFTWSWGPAGTTCRDYFGNVSSSSSGSLIGERGVWDQPDEFDYWVYCSNGPTDAYDSAHVTVLAVPPPPPPNNPPNTPSSLLPPDGDVQPYPAPELSGVFSDPDGDAGVVYFAIYDENATVVRQGLGTSVGNGGRSYYRAYGDLAMGQAYYWQAWSIDADGDWSAGSPIMQVKADRPPATPGLVSPAVAADVPTVYPALSAAGSDPDTGANIYYRFRIFSGAGCATLVDDSDWLWQTSTYRPAPSKLKDGSNYYWQAQALDDLGLPSGLSECRQLNVRLNKLGLREQWPLWTHGPVAVNQATGNLVLSLPGPSYPTAGGTMSAIVSYNSLAPAVDRGLGLRWALNAGDEFASVPVRMVDHNLLSGVEKYDAVERLSEDGGSDYYTRVGSSNTYLSAPGDGSQLSRNANNTWTLVDPDGAIFTFGQAGAGGVLPLESAEYLDAERDKTKLRYCLTGERVTRIRDDICTPNGNPTRELKFYWRTLEPGNCAGALLCIQGPDNVTWKYVGDGANGESGRLIEVHNGTRTIARVSYGANGLPSRLQNANDLNPSQASPGYSTNHSIEITYDGSNCVQQVSEPGTPSVPVWTFAYLGASNTPATQSAHDSLPAGSVRPAAGSTTMTPPRQQGQQNPKSVRVYYDTQARTIATVDLLGNITQVGYSARDLLLWSEDEDGNPTDYSYDPVNDALLSVKGPDPDGTGPLGRPETRYRYDEQKTGTASTAGPAVQGLQAAYFDNANLAGRPKARQTDAMVNVYWGTDAPASLPGTPDNFSIRWTGELHVAIEGDYTLSTFADDGTRLVVDGILAVDKWDGQASAIINSQPIHLKAGAHKLVLEYRELAGIARAGLNWSCASCGIAAAPIPTSALRPAWLNQTSTVSPLGRVTFSHYPTPANGRPDYNLVKHLADDLITSLDYDDYGRVTRKVMPNGNVGRLVGGGPTLTGSPDLRFATTYTYYARGEAAAPPAACPSGAAVNQAELPKSTTSYGLAATTLVYHAAGRAIAKTNGAGTTCTSYDNESRITSTRAPGDAQPTSYTYDPAGARRTATDASGTVTSEYDEAGRLVRSIDSYGAEARLVYDVEGNMTRRTAASTALGGGNDQVTLYSYDEEGKLLSVTDPHNRAYAFTYDRRGNLRTTQYPNSTFSWQEYNAAGWLTALYNRHGVISTPPPAAAPGDASPLADYTYGYDLEGRKTQEVRVAGGLPTETTAYGYDDVGRLATVTLPNATQRTYDFDLDSNRRSFSENGQVVEAYGYDFTASVDRLTSERYSSRTFGYDADGNMTQRGSDALTWDGWGRHTGGNFGGTTVSYGFDPLGFRRSRTSGGITRRYLHGGLFETDGSGSLLRSDIDGPQADLAEYSYSGSGGGSLSAQNLTKYASTTDTASYSTASITPQSNRLLLALVVNTRPFGASPETPTLSGNGLTWTQVATRTAANYRATLFRAIGANPTAGALTASFGGATQTGAIIVLDQISGIDTGGTNGSAAVVQSNSAGAESGATSLTVTLGAFASAANGSYGAFAHSANEQHNPGAGFTEIADQIGHNNPTRAAMTQWKAANDTSVDASWTAAGSAIGLAVELKAAPTSTSTPSYRYYNGHGDLAAEADQAGTRTATYSYDPFGAPREPLTANSLVERWTGRWDKKLDTASSLVEMGARPYDPGLGRFLAVDPVDGGAANAYDYAFQDPVNHYDLDGRSVNIWGRVIRFKIWCSRQVGCEKIIGSADQARSAVRRGASNPYVGACAIGAAQGSIIGGEIGAASGCALGMFTRWLQTRGGRTAKLGKALEALSNVRDLAAAKTKGLRKLYEYFYPARRSGI